MAVLVRGSTRCQVCARVIGEADDVVAFPAFLSRAHALSRYSDAALHRECLSKCDEARAVQALYDRYRRTWAARPPELTTLDQIEAWGRVAFKDCAAGPCEGAAEPAAALRERFRTASVKRRVLEKHMPLLVLGKNMLGGRGAANYRGTYREAPPHSDALPEDSEYNQLHSWYCEAEYEGGVEDADRTRRLLELLRTEVGRRDFEVIEVGRVGDRPGMGRELLGYDLSCALSYSLLSWGLDLHQAQEAPQLPQAIRDLSAVIEAYFRPMLNQHGLFSSEGIAAFCLRSMLALQALSPGLWENEEASDFEVIAILEVTDEEIAASANQAARKMP